MTNEVLIMMLQKKFKEDIFEQIFNRFKPLYLKLYGKNYVPELEKDDYFQEGRIVLLDAISLFDITKTKYFAPFYQVLYKNHMFNIIRRLSAEKRGGTKTTYSLKMFNSQDNGVDFTLLDVMEDDNTLPPYKSVEIRESLSHYVTSLSDFEKLIFAAYLKGMSRKAIAVKYQMSYSQVQSAIERCRDKLKRHLFTQDE